MYSRTMLDFSCIILALYIQVKTEGQNHRRNERWWQKIQK